MGDSARAGVVVCLAVMMSGAGFAQQQGTKSANVDGSALTNPELQVGSRIGRAKIKSKYDVSKIGERGIGGGVNFYSLEKEQALGKQLAQEVERQSKLVDDVVVNEYINRLGQNLVRNSDAKVPFTIKVIEDDNVNAFALPGGYFYVNSGLILAAENEAELAGVMAHEIAHVAARHATRNETKRDIWNLASMPLVFIGGPIGFAVQEAAGLALPLSVLKFSRDAEREADLLGIEYEYASGYDPAEFVQFFEKMTALQKQKPHLIEKAFATHPMNEDRIRRAQDEIQTLLPARDEYVVDTSDFQTVKARLAEIENRGHSLTIGKPVLRHPEKAGSKKEEPPVLIKK